MLENIAYCPVLHTRLAEMRALLQLPTAAKDVIFPIVVARPWPNAKDISLTWEKITDAFGSRRFALDLDHTRSGADNKKPATKQFAALFDPANGFSNYYEVFQTLSSAIPVLRTTGGTAPSFDEQLQHIGAIDRGIVCRIHFSDGGRALSLVDLVLEHFPDLLIVIDTGWNPDLLAREYWASQVIQRITERNPETEIVVTGSSFPNDFSNIEARGTQDLRERMLFSNLVRRHNAASLIYGDWGSTRPPSDPVPVKIIPRIDLPLPDNWIFFRRDKHKAVEETYSDIANRMLADPSWPHIPNIWGTYTIKCTAEDSPGGIKSAGAAAAARINIHLHQQAFFGNEEILHDDEEPYTDE